MHGLQLSAQCPCITCDYVHATCMLQDMSASEHVPFYGFEHLCLDL